MGVGRWEGVGWVGGWEGVGWVGGWVGGGGVGGGGGWVGSQRQLYLPLGYSQESLK